MSKESQNKHVVNCKFQCSWFTTRNNEEIVKDECPYKKNGIKPCVKLGKMCKNLNMELIDEIKIKLGQIT